MTILNDGSEREFIVDTGSTVTKLPSDKKIKYKKILLIKKTIQTSMKTTLNSTGRLQKKSRVGEFKKIPMVITEREDIKPLLCMDCLREFNCKRRHIEKTTITDQ